MNDTVLFLHLLTAFILVVTVVIHSAYALGAPVTPATAFTAARAWDVGGLGTIIFGVWLAIDLDVYDITDGWIIAAIVLWAASAEVGRRAGLAFAPTATDVGAAAAGERPPAAMHWIRTALVVGLLYLMIYKPGA